MWIRSQDRRQLKECKDLNIHNGCIIGEDIDLDDWVNLGMYKSTERTLEVLDEIQQYIEGWEYVETGNSQGDRWRKKESTSKKI